MDILEVGEISRDKRRVDLELGSTSLKKNYTDQVLPDSYIVVTSAVADQWFYMTTDFKQDE